MATVFERVRSIIVEQFGIIEEDITLDSVFFDELNADSINLVWLVMSFEEEFGAETPGFYIEDADAERLLTVREVIEYLNEHGVKDE